MLNRWRQAAVLGAVAAMALAVPAAGANAEVTKGAFHEFACFLH